MTQRARSAGPRTAAAARNRDALIRAARTLLTEEGLDVPLSSIARAASVGQGVLYRHFPTIESIALAVFEDGLAVVETMARDTGTTVEEVMATVVDQITDSAAFILIIDPDRTEDPRLLEIAGRLETLLGAKLGDPHQRGAIAPGITSGDLVTALSMVAAVALKADHPARREKARRAWALLQPGLRE